MDDRTRQERQREIEHDEASYLADPPMTRRERDREAERERHYGFNPDQIPPDSMVEIEDPIDESATTLPTNSAMTC